MESLSKEELSTSIPVVHQVIIIGAGVSGLSAARQFHKNGINDLIILEATSKAGGRILTETLGNGLIELGAQWIHGERNDFCQLAKASNHRHVKTSWEGKGDFLCPNGTKVDNEIVDEILGWIEDSIEEVESAFSIETLQDGDNGNGSPESSSSMGIYLLDKFDRYLKERHPSCEEGSPEYEKRIALFQWGMSFQRIDNSCYGMNDVSLYRWSEFEVNPGEHYNNFARGAQSFVDDVLVGGGDNSISPLVIYDCPVTNINWNNATSYAKVTTEKGSTYLGEIVLLTVSIGVLKSNLESLFTPQIPERLTKAIQSTGYGPVTKIFLEWSQPWWPSDLKGFQLLWPKEYLDCCKGSSLPDELDKIWHKTITGFDPVLDNPNALLAWLGGPEAVYAETLSDEEIANRCVHVLREFTQCNVSKPEKVIVSKWNTNKFFKGAYSFRSVDGDNVKGDICSILSDPIVVIDGHGRNKPVIVLAGEALSKTHYSTLHGAYESGIAQATKIIQYFNSIPSSNSSYSTNDFASENSSCEASSTSTLRKTNHRNEAINFAISVHAANNDIQVPS